MKKKNKIIIIFALIIIIFLVFFGVMTVMQMREKNKKISAESNMLAFVSTVERYLLEESLNNPNLQIEGIYTTKGSMITNIETNNMILLTSTNLTPTSLSTDNILVVDEEGNVSIATIKFENYYVYYYYNDTDGSTKNCAYKDKFRKCDGSSVTLEDALENAKNISIKNKSEKKEKENNENNSTQKEQNKQENNYNSTNNTQNNFQEKKANENKQQNNTQNSNSSIANEKKNDENKSTNQDKQQTNIQTQEKKPDSSNNQQIETTTGQRNALKKAKEYLSVMAFSRDGLVEQLEYAKFSHEEAIYGVDNSNANWNEQAVRKAKDYMDSMPFSKEGLIDQLEYNGFTHEQAVYGAEQNGY